MRDYFHAQTGLTVVDRFKVLDFMVRSRTRFNDVLVEKLFMGLVGADLSVLSTTDRVMCLYLYSKALNYRDVGMASFFVGHIEEIVGRLNQVQLRIFLSSLALINYDDPHLFQRLKK